MRKLVLSVCFGVLLVSASAAQTRPSLDRPTEGYTYFNRPGATWQQHFEDIDGCFEPVAAMPIPGAPGVYDPIAANPGYYNQTYGLAGALAGSLVIAAMQEGQAQRVETDALLAHYENCMVTRGWRVVRTTRRMGRQMEERSHAEFEAELAQLIGAEQPTGEIVRSFHADGADLQTSAPRGSGAAVSLSLNAVPVDRIVLHNFRDQRRPSTSRAQREARRAFEARNRERERRILAARERGDEKPPEITQIAPIEDISAIPADASVVVVARTARDTAFTFELERSNAADPIMTFVVAGPKDEIETTASSTATFVVPPGRWRMSQISVDGVPISLCMGAPAFYVAASEVVFAGAFSDAAPVIAVVPGELALAGAPALQARLRPASYVNGNVSQCGEGAYFYAYEIPGAPFAENYHWGSQAQSVAEPATAP